MIQLALLQGICWSTWAIPIVIYNSQDGAWDADSHVCVPRKHRRGYVFFVLIPMTWAVIAFRANTLDPAIIQIMNDWVWFDWLYTWPPFSIWMFIIAAAILLDRNVPSVYPRWIGFSISGAACSSFPRA